MEEKEIQAGIFAGMMPTTEVQLRADLAQGRIYRLQDKFFKFTFGKPERKELFLDLVNAIVFPDGAHAFNDVTFVDREFSPLRVDGKECRLDIVAVLDDGEQINVEVQVLDRGDYAKRSVYYWSVVHCGQLERGGLYVDTMKTISINILAFDLFKDESGFRNSFSIRNDDSGNKLCDDLAIIYLEIPKYKRSGRKPVNKLERWMAYLAGLEGEEMTQLAEKDPMIETALDVEKLFLMDKMQRLAYIQSWKQMMDDANREETIRRLAMEKGKLEGMAEGKLEGMAEGKAEGKVEGKAEGVREAKVATARKMLARRITVDVIADVTGLTEDEVRSLMN